MRNVIYGAVILLFLSHCSLQDDSEDDVTVEVEPEATDIPYYTPKPTGNYYLAENFDNPDAFKRKWVLSQAKKEGLEEDLAKYDGVWDVEAPRRDALRGDLGLVLKSKAKHAAISAKLEKPFTFKDKPLIVQYEVNFQEGQECGGAYIKLLSEGKETADLRQFVDKTPYTIMFGPDKCGNDVKLHFIFRHQNPNNGSFEEKHCKKPKDRLQEAFEDKKPHLYTLLINGDSSFQVRVDHNLVNEGSLLEDFTPPVNPPSEIDDPNDRKPASWDEREQIPDPEARKPDDWDEEAPRKIIDPKAKKPSDWLEDEATMIPDPDAEKPSDWDTDMDGDWEPPLVDNPACEGISGCGKWEPSMIDNPAYKGKWRPPLIDNPNYQGKWRPRKIVNPDYYFDSQPYYRMTPISAVGFELWSMSPAILFDNILITDSMAVANDYAAASYNLKKRKIDADSVSFYGKMMKSINYKPGWWSVYFVYCLIPIVGYGYFLYRRVKEESVLTSFLKYSNDRPYLYGVYIILIGLPIALLVVYCCGGPSKDADDSVQHPKKTDEVQPDDAAPPRATSKSDLGVPDDAGDDLGDEEDEEDEEDDEGEDTRDTSPDEDAEVGGDGDGPRQRRTRKE